jgi:GH24 family phage-related lysozyme (muramidase)
MVSSYILETYPFHKEPHTYSNGLIVLGYGHRMSKEEPYKRLTKNKAKELFYKDKIKIETYLNKRKLYTLTQEEFDVLFHFIYDHGVNVTNSSRFAHFLLTKNTEEACKEILRWKSYRGLYDKNLADRRDYDYNILKFKQYEIGITNESKSRRITFNG